MKNNEYDYDWLAALNITADMIENNTKKLPILWISGQECTGCGESFLRGVEPSTLNTIIDYISVEYSELLSAASGVAIESHIAKIAEEYKNEYILVIEGSVPEDDAFLMVSGRSIKEEIVHLAKTAKAVVAAGSCAAWGGIPAAFPNPTNSSAATDFIAEEIPLALVPGCPPIAEVMIGTLLHVHFHGELPELDKKKRPKVFFHTTVHLTCHRKPFFDKKLFSTSFDDGTIQEGYCLLKLGCKGPSTFNACESIGWNGEKTSPIRAGNPCIGCAEKNFWDKGSFCGAKKKSKIR